MTTTEKSPRDDAINFHIGQAHRAAETASIALNDALTPQGDGITAEQWLELRRLNATIARAAAHVVDSHTRLLELRLAIGGSAL